MNTNGQKETVSFVIPVYNEEEALPHLIRAIEEFRVRHREVTRVILVDDGSSDSSADLIKDLTTDIDGYTLLTFSRNFGHQIAITAGLLETDSDAAVILDADLQDPLVVVEEMIRRWRQGHDVVYGVRSRRKGDAAFKTVTAAVFYRLFRLMTDVDMPLDTGDFRLISRPVIDAYRRFGEQKPFVRGLVAWMGFNQTAVEYDREERIAGQTKYTLPKMMRLAFDSLTSFSDRPLRLAVRIGFIIALVSGFGGAVWAILAKFVVGSAISGWASLLLVITFFGGLNLFFLGIVGSYLARVFDEVKGRPRYFIADRWDSIKSDAGVRQRESAARGTASRS